MPALAAVLPLVQRPYADAAAVAASLQPDEPVFCFSPAQLAARARVFLNGFPGEVSFAVKSNPAACVLSTLAKAGLSVFDVASVREMEAVRAAVGEAEFHYHNPVKSRGEIAAAHARFGCRRFAADSPEEIAKIADIVGGDASVEVAVRFVLPPERGASAHDFSTKFGAHEHAAIALLADVAKRGYRPVLTFHPGSQAREPQAYVRHIEAAARIAKGAGVALAALNVGGGFPANYATSTAPEPDVFFRVIDKAVRRCFGPARPKLECEPGRGLVATSMSLLTRVKLVCSDADDLFINDGVYGGLMECWQAPALMPPHRLIRDGAVLEGESRAFKVFGPTCDPLDALPDRLDLPQDVREGDYIEFGTLGAYGIATSTRFNGYGDHAIVEVEEALVL